ncbi:MAG: AarF/ABC1/UbiB kinase family protein [Paracoccaceae bacterium]|nr:AarF/ABC1/UbiB kinase family protein [Paracoccaceae bacterium]
MTIRSTPKPQPVPASRLGRLSRLGALGASVAGNMVVGGLGQLAQGQRPNPQSLLMTPRNMRKIVDQLAQMRGAAMKIGQLVSMDTGDVLPPELSEIFARLRADANFMPPKQLKQVLAKQWPAGWLGAFSQFDVRPIAAASIGQVHRAVLRDGRTLAVKVQYPGVARSIDSDVANVSALIRMSGLLPKGFELGPYLEQARLQLHEETDYIREAAQLDGFADLLVDNRHFHVPRSVPEWCTPDILAMEFAEGDPVEDAARADQATRNHITEQLIRLTLDELFRFGRMQTDPNFANYRFDAENGKIVLLDFGATRVVGAETAQVYRDMLVAGLSHDAAGIDAAAGAMGLFDADTTVDHRRQINEMMSLIFAELEEMPVFDFATTELVQHLQRRGTALAEDGYVPPPLPIDVLFLQRKFGGMFMLASKLGASLPLRDILAEAIS